MFYFSWNGVHGWGFNNINHSQSSASLQWERTGSMEGSLLVFLICCIRPQTCLRKHSLTFSPAPTVHLLHLVPSLHISFFSFLSPHHPSFLSVSSLTHPLRPSGDFLDGAADFRSVYRQDLRKSTSDKRIPWIHKTSRYISSKTAPRRIRPKVYYRGKDVS